MINFENLIVGIMLLTSILLIAYAFLKKDTDEKIGLICAGLLLGVFGVGSANGIKAENKTPKYIQKTIILNQKSHILTNISWLIIKKTITILIIAKIKVSDIFQQKEKI